MKLTFSFAVLAVVLTVGFADFSEEERRTLVEFEVAKVKCEFGNEVIDNGVENGAKDEFCMNVKMGIQKPNGDYDNERKEKIDKILRNAIKEKKKHIEKMRKSIEECNANPATNFGLASFNRFKDGNPTDKDKMLVAKHLLCVQVKRGFQRPNGDYKIDNIKKSLENLIFEPTLIIDNVLATCGTRPAGSSAEKAALALYKCLSEINMKRTKSNLFNYY